MKLLITIVAIFSLCGLSLAEESPGNSEAQLELKGKNRDSGQPSRQQIEKWISRLGDKDFSIREDAEKNLLGCDANFLESLRKGSKVDNDLEVQGRLDRIIYRIKGGDQIDEARSVLHSIKSTAEAGDIESIKKYIPEIEMMRLSRESVLSAHMNALKRLDVECMQGEVSDGKVLFVESKPKFFGENQKKLLVMVVFKEKSQWKVRGDERTVELNEKSEPAQEPEKSKTEEKENNPQPDQEKPQQRE